MGFVLFGVFFDNSLNYDKTGEKILHWIKQNLAKQKIHIEYEEFLQEYFLICVWGFFSSFW